MARPAQRRGLAAEAVAAKELGIAPACRAFGPGKTGFRHGPKRDQVNELAACQSG